MADLSGTKIADTYDSLLKFGDNGTVETDTVQVISDGRGTDTSLSLSTHRATFKLGGGAADDFIIENSSGVDQLVVVGDAGAGEARVGIQQTAPTAFLDIHSGGSSSPDIQLAKSNSSWVKMWLDGTEDYRKGLIISSHSGGAGANANINFYTEEAHRMIIKENGYVGIGMTAPTALFEVLGNSKLANPWTPHYAATAVDTDWFLLGQANYGTNEASTTEDHCGLTVFMIGTSGSANTTVGMCHMWLSMKQQFTTNTGGVTLLGHTGNMSTNVCWEIDNTAGGDGNGFIKIYVRALQNYNNCYLQLWQNNGFTAAVTNTGSTSLPTAGAGTGTVTQAVAADWKWNFAHDD
tara:strand:+ start:250 stop:1299 length:1050 start_codon:yes stop_codon:yes gene_type:complete